MKTYLNTHSFLHLLPLIATLPGTLHIGTASAQSPGVVNFTMHAPSDFDTYTSRPSLATRQWMRDHYYRMIVYTPYFDSRTSWYPRGNVYVNLYGIQRGSYVELNH